MKTRISCKNLKKTATKNCPCCHQQVPTACKSCSCGHFFRKAPAPEVLTTPSDAVKRRRTERTRRERPHFYSAIEYIHLPRRQRKTSKSNDKEEIPKRRRSSQLVTKPVLTNKAKDKDVKDGEKSNSQTANHADGRENASQAPKEEADPFASVTAEKAMQYAIQLQEINRKFGAQNFVPS